MARDHEDDSVNQAIRRFFAIPIIFLISIFTVGEVITILFGIPRVATYLFTAIGGVGFIVWYYRDQLRKFMSKYMD